MFYNKLSYSINRQVLDNIEKYREIMNLNINEFLGQFFYATNNNVFLTPNYHIYSIIDENIRMDLNSLLATNVNYDIFGFLGVRRNIRNTIEAYYDLFNLTNDPYYYYVLKKFSNNIAISDEELQTVKNNNRYRKFIEKKHFTIKDKASIAKCNNLNKELYDKFKNISVDSNSFVHPDIFVPIKSIEEKALLLKDLLDIDCLLLAFSFHLLMTYCKANYQNSITNYFDPFIELNMLSAANNGLYYIQCQQ